MIYVHRCRCARIGDLENGDCLVCVWWCRAALSVVALVFSVHASGGAFGDSDHPIMARRHGVEGARECYIFLTGKAVKFSFTACIPTSSSSSPSSLFLPAVAAWDLMMSFHG